MSLPSPTLPPECGEPTPHSEVWPACGHYLAMAGVCLFVVIYGSLVPLKFTALSWNDAVRQFAGLFHPPFQRCSWTDAIANFLLMVPVNYCLLAALVGGRRARWQSLAWSPVVLIGSATFSVGIEFLQLWFRERTPSIYDIGAQILGGAVGLMTWLALGPHVAHCLQSLRFDRRPSNFVDWTLRAYVVGMLAWVVWPLNMTLSPAQWYHKYKQGLVILKPLENAVSTLQAVVDGATTLVVFIPVGMWAASVWTTPRRPVRSVVVGLLVGAFVALVVMAIDLVVVSRTVTSATLLFGIPGILAGVLIMHRWRGSDTAEPTDANSIARPDGAATGAWWWLIAAICYALLLVAWFCPPQQIATDPESLRARFLGFFRLPLEALYRGSFLNAVKEVLRKGLLFAPLGGLLAMAALRWPIPAPARKFVWALIVVAAAMWATGIEMLQILLPLHVSDSTDVVLCAAGAALGVVVAIRLDHYGSGPNP